MAEMDRKSSRLGLPIMHAPRGICVIFFPSVQLQLKFGDGSSALKLLGSDRFPAKKLTIINHTHEIKQTNINHHHK